jgi:hypothetical protein
MGYIFQHQMSSPQLLDSEHNEIVHGIRIYLHFIIMC